MSSYVRAFDPLPSAADKTYVRGETPDRRTPTTDDGRSDTKIEGPFHLVVALTVIAVGTTTTYCCLRSFVIEGRRGGAGTRSPAEGLFLEVCDSCGRFGTAFERAADKQTDDTPFSDDDTAATPNNKYHKAVTRTVSPHDRKR